MRSPIRFDKTDTGVIVYCDDHDWYNAFRFTLDDARQAACAHEKREHAGDYHHRDAARKRAAYRRVATVAG